MKPLVSLDVFDTAIFRKVFYPTDIFNVVEDKVGNNFKVLRVEAQRAAAKKNPFYNIIDIYKEMKLPFNPKEEIKAEYENCVANPYILDMYNKGEADYIFISDMYLPAIVIKSMLEKCGYKDPKVYVSCELKAMKADGGLFKKVEDTLQREIIKHIGDNYNADILGAKRAGIKEVEYIGPPIYNKKVITPLLANVKLRKILIDKELSNASIEEKIGYQFAPMVLSFTQSILREATDKDTIFFNARDCFVMYIIARWLIKTKKKIKYCRFSRKSCAMVDILPNYAINNTNNRAALTNFKMSRIVSLRDFLKLHNFNESRDYSPILNKYGIRMDSDIEFHPKRVSLIEDVLILLKDDLQKKVIEEKENFLKYIGIIQMKDNDIFVDIGYKGTMQGIITRVANKKLRGRYLDIYGSTIGRYYGVLFEKKSFFPPDFFAPYGGGVIEYVLTEPKGTVVGYDKEGKPVLLKDTKIRKDISRKLIRGVLDGCKDLLKEGVEASVNDCLKILKRYLDEPTMEEAVFGNQPLFENGSHDRNESLTWFDKKRIREGKLVDCYRRSYWKAAFKLLLQNDPELQFLTGELK